MGDHTRGTDVAEENLSVGAEGRHPFLDTSATGIVHADDGPTGLEGHVEDLANFQAVHFTQRATVDREILGESENFPTVDGPVAGDHAVAWDDVLVHVKISAAVFNQRIDFLEAAVIEQQFESLTGRHLPSVVLGFNTGLTAASLAASLAIS